MRGRDRGRLKSRVIRAAMGGEERAAIDAWARAFAAGLGPRGKFRAAALATLEAHRAAGDHLVLLSASPDLYVPCIGRALSFERTLCTEVLWARRPARRRVAAPPIGAARKSCAVSRRCAQQYPNARLTAYGNSASDLAHLRRADRAVLVNAGAAARWLAASSRDRDRGLEMRSREQRRGRLQRGTVCKDRWSLSSSASVLCPVDARIGDRYAVLERGSDPSGSADCPPSGGSRASARRWSGCRR